MWGFNFENKVKTELDIELVGSRKYLADKNTKINALKDLAGANTWAQKILKIIPDGKFARLRKHLLKNIYEGVDYAVPNPTSGIAFEINSDSVLGPKGRKILESHLRKPTPSSEELYQQKEDRVRGPTCIANYHLHKIDACLKAKVVLSRLSVTRG